MKKIIFWILLFLSFYSNSYSYDIYFSDPGRLYYKNDFTNLYDRWTELLSVYNFPNFVITKDKKYLYYYKSVNANNWYWNNIVRRNLLDNSETIIVYNVESSSSNNISLSSDDKFLYYNTRELDLMRFDLINNKSSLFYSNSYSPLVNWDYVYLINRNDNFTIYRKNIITWNTTKFLNLWNNNLFFYNDNVYFYNRNDYTIRYKPITDNDPNNLWTILISNVNWFPKSNNINSNVFLYSLRSNSNQTLIFDLSKNSSSVLFNFAWFSNYYITNSIPQYCRTELLNFQYPTIFDDFLNNNNSLNDKVLFNSLTKVIPFFSDFTYSSWAILWNLNWSIQSPIDFETNQWLVVSIHNTKLQWITLNWTHSDYDYFYIAYQDKVTWEPKRLKPLENWWNWRRFNFSDEIINLRWYEELVDNFVYIIFEKSKFDTNFKITNLKIYQYSPQFYDTKVCYKINLSDFWLKTDSNNNIIDENWKKYDINKKWELVDENWKLITQIQDINYNWEDKKIEDIYDYNWQLEQEIKNEIEDEKKQINNEFIKKIFWENWSIILTSLVDQLTFDSEKIKENTIKNVPIPNIENNKLNYDTKIDIKVQMPKPITIHYKARIEPNAWELFIVTIICIVFIIFKALFIVIYFLPLLTISKFASFIQSYILPHLSSNNFWWNWISFISYILYFSWLIVLFYLFFAFILPFYTIISLMQNTSWIFLYNISLFFNWWNYFLWLLELFFAWIYTVIILYVAYVLSLKFWRVN